MRILHLLGATIQSTGGGGGVAFVADKWFFSTRLGRALKISNFITCLYRTLLHVNYLFHAESARNYLFKKKLKPPLPPGDWMVAPVHTTFWKPKLFFKNTALWIVLSQSAWNNVVLILVHRLRHWPNIETTLVVAAYCSSLIQPAFSQHSAITSCLVYPCNLSVQHTIYSGCFTWSLLGLPPDC